MMLLDAGIWEHLPPAVFGSILGAALVLGTNMVRAHISRGRAKEKIDTVSSDMSAVFQQLNELTKDITAAQIDLAVLKNTVEGLPGPGQVRDQIQAMEDRMSKRLEHLSSEVRSVFAEAMKQWKCPMDHKKS